MPWAGLLVSGTHLPSARLFQAVKQRPSHMRPRSPMRAAAADSAAGSWYHILMVAAAANIWLRLRQRMKAARPEDLSRRVVRAAMVFWITLGAQVWARVRERCVQQQPGAHAHAQYIV